MIPSFVLSLREGLEAALIIGIVLGALRKTGNSSFNRPLWAGVISAVGLSLLTAILLHALDKELEGRAEQIFEGLTLLMAAGVLTWMIFWMQQQSTRMAAKLMSNINRATRLGSQGTIFFLAFIAVVREGIELALYLTATSLSSSGIQIVLGALIGLLAASLLGYLIYNSTLRLNLQRFFQVTAVVLILFAAGLIDHSIVEFNEVGIIPAVISPIWNINPLLNDHSIVGMFLSTLFGYHGSPSLTEVLAYGGYLLVILWVIVKPQRLLTR